MIAQAEHIPVHLGAMPDAVAAVMRLGLEPGQVAILNDPYTGGTHLPDVTLVSRTALGYAVSRAHHADVGGIEPASLPAFSHTLEEEGVILPPQLLTDEVLERFVERDAAAGGAARRPPRPARRASPGRAAARGAVRAPRPRPRRRRDGRALRVLRADGAGGDRRAPGRSRRGRGRRRGGRRRPADPLHGRDRGRRDPDRLRRDGAAVRRQPQLPARGDEVGLLLRRPLPHRAGPAGLGRRLRAGHRDRARGLPRQRAPAGGRRRRQHRDLVAHRRRRLRRARPSSCPCPRRARGR